MIFKNVNISVAHMESKEITDMVKDGLAELRYRNMDPILAFAVTDVSDKVLKDLANHLRNEMCKRFLWTDFKAGWEEKDNPKPVVNMAPLNEMEHAISATNRLLAIKHYLDRIQEKTGVRPLLIDAKNLVDKSYGATRALREAADRPGSTKKSDRWNE
jgi:hypothetical protein